MFLRSNIEIKSNVFITFRERGKKVNSFEGHNRWVNLGREYIPRAMTPTAEWGHLEPAVIKYMGFGIGGQYQTADTSGALDTDYPGQKTFDHDDLTVVYLERPVKVTGTAGIGTSPGVWMNPIIVNGSTPAFIGTPASTVEYMALFSETDLYLSGAYSSVPLSEIGLFLSTQTASLVSNQVYDYGASPAYINTSTRQKLVAYFPFSPIQKTSLISVEVRWQLQC